MFIRYITIYELKLLNSSCVKYIYSRSLQTLVKSDPLIQSTFLKNDNHPSIYELPKYDSKLRENIPCLALPEKHLKSLSLNDILVGTTYYIQTKENIQHSKLTGDLRNSLHLNQILVKNVHTFKPELYKLQNTYKINELPSIYLKLSKARLTAMVVMTQMCGYYLAPGVFDSSIFMAAALGTCLTSCAANTINQLIEIPYDSQMNRTKNRILVTGKITPLHAAIFASFTGTLGVLALWYLVNPLTAVLGASNLALYTLVYTRYKRVGIINTWLGAVVGALPPVMGWTANCGNIGIGGLLLGALLYTWQFPHFNALSWNLKAEYSRAGYRMMSAVRPTLCLVTALRHSLYSLPVIAGLFALPLYTNRDFDLMHIFSDHLMLLPNSTAILGSVGLGLGLYNVALCIKFYQKADSRSSRKLFRFSLINLPLLMGLVLINATLVGDNSLHHSAQDVT